MVGRMTLNDRIEALAALGDYLKQRDERLEAHTRRAEVANPWFTRDNIDLALTGFAEDFLPEKSLKNGPVPTRLKRRNR